MEPVVKLKEIVEEMDLPSEEGMSFWSKKSGKVVLITDEMMEAAEEGTPLEDYPDWMRGSITLAGDILKHEADYVPLPSKYDLHEYQIMESFCRALKDPKITETLLADIKGRGAFGRFKNRLQQLGLEREWHQFREEALKRIAVEWCRANGLQYIDE
jgi:hypothetical protein